SSRSALALHDALPILWSNAISFQHYSLSNYNTGLFTFGDGYSNNLAYTIGISRNNTATNPIYPTSGSEFSISAKLTPPYSAFNRSEEHTSELQSRENL